MLITLEHAKSFLDVIHSEDDAVLQTLLDGAIDEAMQFLDREDFSDCGLPEGEYPDSVVVGILILLQANYQASPKDIVELRHVAETKLMPYRKRLGI